MDLHCGLDEINAALIDAKNVKNSLLTHEIFNSTIAIKTFVF